MYKRALGETFQFLYIWPLSTLRSTIGVNTIRPIKENFQWHFGGAAYCLSKQGFGGDTCTFFARSSPQHHPCCVFQTTSEIIHWRLFSGVNQVLLGQSRKKCTSVSPPARFGKTTGSHPKVPLKIFLYWSDCEDINCWPQSWPRTNIRELKCLPPSPFTL